MALVSISSLGFDFKKYEIRGCLLILRCEMKEIPMYTKFSKRDNLKSPPIYIRKSFGMIWKYLEASGCQEFGNILITTGYYSWKNDFIIVWAYFEFYISFATVTGV